MEGGASNGKMKWGRVRVEKGELESDDEGKEAGEMRLLVIHIMYELW